MVQAVLSKTSIEAFEAYLPKIYKRASLLEQLRANYQLIDREYAREGDRTDEHRKAITALRGGDKSKLANLTIPVILPQIESALAILADTFLSGSPIFPVVADPGNLAEVEALEAEIEIQSVENGWRRQLLLSMNDGLKYNVMGIECDWVAKKTNVLTTDLSYSSTEAKVTSKFNYQNVYNRVDPYNFIFDPIVALGDMHTKGEFAGYYIRYSRIQLFDYLKSLPQQFLLDAHVKLALASEVAQQYYYEPSISQDLGGKPVRDDWSTFPYPARSKGLDEGAYGAVYEVTKLYCRIVAEDFDLDAKDDYTPEVWKLVFVNHKHLIYAERLTNAHGYLPIVCGQILEDGLTYQTKSPAENLIPIQDMASTLFNYYIASARRSVSDRALYDPSRISKESVNSTSPTAKIAVKPSAYGRNLAEAYQQIPFDNRDAGIAINNAFQVMEFGSKLTGINKAQEGGFTKGNRSRAEFTEIMGNSNSRLLLSALRLQDQLFTPLKLITKTNILQYKNLTEIFSPITRRILVVNAEKMRSAALYFKLADGLNPSTRQYDTEFIQYLLQFLTNSPEEKHKYRMTELLGFLAQSRGFGELKFFELAPEELQQQQQQRMAEMQQATAAQQPQPQQQRRE